MTAYILFIITLFAYIYIVSQFVYKRQQLRKQQKSHFNITPFYLVCIPAIVVFIRFIFIGPAIEHSRKMAIMQRNH